MIVVERHGRGGHRQVKRRLRGVIHQAMERVHRRREQAAGAPLNILRHAIALLDLRHAFALENVNHFFIKMAFRLGRCARRNLTDVDPGDAFQPAQLQIRPFAADAAPWLEREISHVGDAKAFDDGDALFLDPALVISFRPRPRRADLGHFRIHIRSISF